MARRTDLSTKLAAIAFIGLLIAIGAAVASHRDAAAARARTDAMDERIEELRKRITTLEARIGTPPALEAVERSP